MMGATAHTVALDAGAACVFLALINRHALKVTAESGRRTWRTAAHKANIGKMMKKQRRIASRLLQRGNEE